MRNRKISAFLFLFTFLFLLVQCFHAKAQETPSAASSFTQKDVELLNRARIAPGNESWAKLQGKIQHLRKDEETISYQIYLGIKFTREMIVAQVVINEQESYIITQTFVQPETTIIKNGNSDSAILNEIGVRPEDLTMSFLYWQPEAALGSETYKTCACRKLSLLSPDKKEKAVLLLSVEQAFPLKVQWIKTNETEPYRTMEVSSFKKENDYWFVTEINSYGPGWRTKITFDNTSVGTTKDGTPPNIFKQIENPSN